MSDDDKQLTVAELLARAGKDSPSPTDKSRRRRRRSLEEGGISVAELTGSIPKVKEAPAESRHSAVPIDAPTEATPPTTADKADEAAEKPAGKPGQVAGKSAETEQKPGKPVTTPAGAAPAQPTKAPDKADKADKDKSAEQPAKPADKADKATEKAAKSPTKPADRPAKQPAKPADKTDRANKANKANNADTAEKAEKTEKAENSVAATATEKKAPAKPAPTTKATPVAKPPVSAATPTAPPEQTDTGKSDTGKPDTGESDPTAPATRDTTVLGKVDAEDPVRVKPGTPTTPAPSPTPVKSAAASAAVLGATPDAGETGQMPVVETGGDDVRGAGDTVDTDGPADGDEQISMGAVLLMALAGIVLGVLVFLGFELLWDRFNRVIVGLLALAVTGVMVAVVHAMRTTRDGLSMFLAGVVGLVMTFGPLAIIVL